MKKLFTLFAMLVVAVCASAQLTAVTDKTWNFSDWEPVTYNATTIIDNLEVVCTSDATVAVDNNSKSIDDFNFTRRIKMGGTGKAESRHLHFKVAGDCDITVYGMSASSSETRTLNIDTGSFGSNVATFENDGSAISKVEYSYKGGETDVYIYSQKSGFNIYAIVVKQNVDDTPTEKEYDVKITSDPENVYNSGEFDLDLADVAAALGTDEAGLAALINGNQSFYLETSEGKTNSTTGNTGENAFWMDNAANNVGYGGEGSCWYTGIYYQEGSSGSPYDVNEDLAININDVVAVINKMAGTADWPKSDVNGDEKTDINDVVAIINAMANGESAEPTESRLFIRCGQMPNYYSKIYEDTDLYCTVYLITGNKSVKFNVNLHVNAAEEPVEMLLSNLNIVKDYEIVLPFKTNKTSDATVTATFDGIYDALGTTAEELDASVSNATIYAQTVTSETVNEEVVYSLTDNLSTLNDLGYDGWFGRYTNWEEEGGGKEVPLPINGPKQWGGSCTFYLHDIALADGEFSVFAGQYVGTMAVGDTDYTYLYIVNGKDAARIKVQAEVTESDYVDPSQWTEVGTMELTQSATRLSDYLELNTPIENIDEIAEALGFDDSSQITYYHLNSGGNGFDNDLSDGWGAWLDENGCFTTWGANSAIMVAYELADGVYQFSTLQIPTSMSEKLYDGVELKFPVYLVNDEAGKYYTINFTYQVNIPDIDIEFVQKYAAAYDVQLIQSEGYSQASESRTQVDLEAIAAAIGTNSPTLFGESWTTNDDGSRTMKYSDSYSCTPYPGFWMAQDGESVDKWAATCAYGMTYASSGLITYYVHPDSNHQEGETFHSRFYLVNEETGDYALITLDIEYVTVRGQKADEIGRCQAGITISDENIGDLELYEGAEGVDWSTVFSTLGIDETELADCSWMVTSSSGKLVNASDGDFEGENYLFTAEGLGTSDIASAVFAVGFNSDTKAFTVSLFGADPEPGAVYKTNVALKSDNGYYVFELTITVPEE